MTDRSAAELKSQLDAMRLVRAEDHRACARLAARAKELEAEVASLANARDYWMAKAGEQAGAVMRAHGMLAEGTRDGKARRCQRCYVPIGDSDTWCAGCDGRGR